MCESLLFRADLDKETIFLKDILGTIGLDIMRI